MLLLQQLEVEVLFQFVHQQILNLWRGLEIARNRLKFANKFILDGEDRVILEIYMSIRMTVFLYNSQSDFASKI